MRYITTSSKLYQTLHEPDRVVGPANSLNERSVEVIDIPNLDLPGVILGHNELALGTCQCSTGYDRASMSAMIDLLHLKRAPHVYQADHSIYHATDKGVVSTYCHRNNLPLHVEGLS